MIFFGEQCCAFFVFFGQPLVSRHRNLHSLYLPLCLFFVCFALLLVEEARHRRILGTLELFIKLLVKLDRLDEVSLPLEPFLLLAFKFLNVSG